MWNRTSLAAPPVCELKVTLTQRNRDSLHKALRSFNSGTDVLREHEGFLTSEQYVMRKTVYKLANQFAVRNPCVEFGRSLLIAEMLSCLRRMHDVQPSVLLKTIKEYVNINSAHEEEQYLVSLQTIQYHLVRLQGLAALLQQTVNYCLYTFFHIRQHMEAGKMVPQNIVMLSGTARIWYVCSSLCDYVCNWYRALHQCQDVFQSTQVVWLEESLPSNLKRWLAELFPDEKSTEFSPSMMVEHLTSSDNKHVTAPKTESVSFASNHSLGDEDIGEPIKRQEDVTAEETATQHAKTKKKGPKKLEQKKDLKVQNNDQSDTIPADVSVHTMKLAIKKCIKTPEDLNKFKTQVKKKILELNDSCWRISKLGKKKILKKIAMVTEKVNKEVGTCSEKVVIKKIRLPVSKLIIKYLDNSDIDKKLAVANTLAMKKDIPVDMYSEVLNNNVDETYKGSNVKRKKLGENSKTKKTKVGQLKSDKVINMKGKKKSKKNRNKLKRLK